MNINIDVLYTNIYKRKVVYKHLLKEHLYMLQKFVYVLIEKNRQNAAEPPRKVDGNIQPFIVASVGLYGSGR